MARKNLLAGLLEPDLTAVKNDLGGASVPAPPVSPQAPHGGISGTRGAIGAVARSMEQLKAQSILDLDPNLIDASVVADRLENSDEHHRSLMESIREHGQQVPILVRPHPEHEGRFQIAYGRRRLQAIRELGRKIRAVVKELSDTELVVAQGQENSSRQDLTFIEKALFAERLKQAGHGSRTIKDALSIDDSVLSRFKAVTDAVPADLIEAIGPAATIGRPRWLELAGRLEKSGAAGKARGAVTAADFAALPTDQRFELVFTAVAPKAPKATKPVALKSTTGVKYGQATDTTQQLTLTISKKDDGAFAAHLLETLPKLHAEFMEREGKT